MAGDKVAGLDDGLTSANEGLMSFVDGLEYIALLVLPTILMVEDGTRWLLDEGCIEAAEGTREDVVEICLCGVLPSASNFDTGRRLTTMTSLEISMS